MICDTYVTGLWNCFFAAQFWPRLFYSGYFAYSAAILLALTARALCSQLWQKRFEIVLLATLPVVGAFIRGDLPLSSGCLLAIPFWVILMSFTFAALLKLRPWPGVQIVAWCPGRVNTARRIGPIGSIHLWQDEKSVFDSPLCAI